MRSMKHPLLRLILSSFFVHDVQSPEQRRDWWRQKRWGNPCTEMSFSCVEHIMIWGILGNMFDSVWYVSHMRFLSAFAWWCCWLVSAVYTSVQDLFCHWEIQLFPFLSSWLNFVEHTTCSRNWDSSASWATKSRRAFRVYSCFAPNLVPSSHRPTSETWNTLQFVKSACLVRAHEGYGGPLFIGHFPLALWGFPRSTAWTKWAAFFEPLCFFLVRGSTLKVKDMAIQLYTWPFVTYPPSFHSSEIGPGGLFIGTIHNDTIVESETSANRITVWKKDTSLVASGILGGIIKRD